MARPQQVRDRPEPEPEAQEQKGVIKPSGKFIRRSHGPERSVRAPRDVTSINPEKMEPVDPRMVYMPPP